MSYARKYFEDFAVGDVIDCGTAQVSREDIVEFARNWDPIPIHVDPEYASSTQHGDIIASGLHMMSLCRRLVVDAVFKGCASLGSPGTEKVRFPKPMRPGYTVRALVRVVETAPSTSKPDRGRITYMFELLEEREGLLMEWTALGIMARRPAAGAE